MAFGGVGGFVSPLFVAPEPEFGIFFDHGFHDVPAGLGDLLVGGVLRQVERGMVDKAEAAVGFGKNLAWDEACATALGEDAGDRAHGCPEAETADWHGAVFWIDAEIGGGADFSSRAQELDHPNERARRGNNRMATSGPEAVKNGTERWIFKGLGNNQSRRDGEGTSKADPFEIRKVGEEINARRVFVAVDGMVVEALNSNVVLVIFGGQIRRPEQAEHRSSEVLARLARDAGALGGRVGGAECNAQIFDSHSAAARIEVEEDEAERIGNRLESGVGQARNEGFDEFETKKFEFVAQTLETGNSWRRSLGCGIFSAHGAWRKNPASVRSLGKVILKLGSP